jgi:hypothetical protein
MRLEPHHAGTVRISSKFKIAAKINNKWRFFERNLAVDQVLTKRVVKNGQMEIEPYWGFIGWYADVPAYDLDNLSPRSIQRKTILRYGYPKRTVV